MNSSSHSTVDSAVLGHVGRWSGLWHGLVATSPSWSALVLRLGLAAMLWPHGAQKLLGWFGGSGFSGTYGYLSQSLPGVVALLVIVGEFFAPLLLVTGFLTRFAAGSIGVIMAGAALMHVANGFFMNWTGAQSGEGIEFHILAFSMALALAIQGAGSVSVDRRLTRAN